MNWLKAIFQVLKKINFIVDLLIEILENWNSEQPVKNLEQKINELKKIKG